ncbi:MAG: formylglycine-generating enzyme family protein [Bacteroidota bacterium]
MRFSSPLIILALCSVEWAFPNPSESLQHENLLFVEGGSFAMGNPDEHFSYEVQHPVHWVSLSSFYIEKYEVTNQDYVQFLNALASELEMDSLDVVSPASWGIKQEEDICIDVLRQTDSVLKSGIVLSQSDAGIRFELIAGKETFPVTSTTWYGARAYCKWKYPGGSLPSEAQWEYAARGGKHWQEFDYKYAGSNALDSVGWYWSNAKFKPHSVGTKHPNNLGIYDMSGNLWEWIEDHWHANYNNAPTDGSAWVEKEVKKDFNRVLRGGAWFYSRGAATVTNRWSDVPDDRHAYKGFRCVCDAP